MFISRVFYKDYNAHFGIFFAKTEENKKNGSTPFLGWTVAPCFVKHRLYKLDVMDLGRIRGL